MKIAILGRILIIVGAIVGAASPAFAGEFVPAANLKDMVIDLDTQSGSYSAWRMPDLASINALRATIQIHRLGNDPKWLPGFTLTVGSSEDSFAFQLVSETRQPPLAVHAYRIVGGKSVDDHAFASSVGLDQKLDVAIDWTASGQVTVRLGTGESYTVSLKGPVTSLQISGSTGEIECNPFSLGHAGP